MKRLLFLIFLSTAILNSCRNKECTTSSELPVIPGWNIKLVNGPYWQGGDIVDFSFPNRFIGYLSTQSGDIYKTTNSGEDWAKLDLPDLANRKPTTLYIDDANLGWVYLDTTALGVGTLPFAWMMKTYDGGENWMIYRTNIRGKIKHLGFASPDRGMAIIQKPNTNYGVYYTNNGGVTWIENTSVFLGNETPRFTSIYTDPVVMCVVDVNNKVWITEDGGLTWRFLFSPGNALIHQIFTSNENDIYYTQDDGLFLYKVSSSTTQQLSENKTKILFFSRENAGVTFQKTQDCNADYLNNMDFNSGYISVFAKKNVDESWTESENSKVLSDWKPNYVEGGYTFCSYKYFLYYIEPTQ